MPSLVPRLGLGTSTLGVKLGDGPDGPDECIDAVGTALELGYRHVDTAQMHGHENLVGTGIQQADVGHEDAELVVQLEAAGTAVTSGTRRLCDDPATETR